MPTLRATPLILCCALLAASGELAWAADAGPLDYSTGHAVLGSVAPCEASGARVATCSSGAGRCLFVVDNEESELFEFSITGSPARLSMVAKRDTGGIKDVEALVDDGAAWLLVGSHSSNKRCDYKKKRQRLVQVPQRGGESTLHEREDQSCERLGLATTSPLCAEVDARWRRGEGIQRDLAAKRITKQHAEQMCDTAPPLNIEGAARVASGAVWFGLRSPVVGFKAPLMRRASAWRDVQAPLTDAVAWLDLGGFGVRELAWFDGHLYVIAGPEGDAAVPFRLYRFAGEPQPGETQTGVVVATLPPSTEGMAFADERVWFVIDGNEPNKNKKRCRAPAGVFTIPLDQLIAVK